ncbi:MAG: anion permease [Candidatus Undinarchaeales archaeon]|jgi:PiT family inorganic phosphate transporter|nr:anion permease [Candidatus Undinarchaeales archaeon]MDP7493165.1 anion permease [Candidatus Undinarchaeales archaeon]
MDPLSILIIGACLLVAWNIGANDASNAIGTTVGGGILPFHKAVIIVVVFALLGATLEGYKVMKTVGKGIVPAVECETDEPCRAINAEYTCAITSPPNAKVTTGECRSHVNGQKIIYLEKDRRAVLAAFLAAGVFMLAITALKIPTSTTQALIGAVAGAGIGLNLFGGMPAPINYAILKTMLVSWVLSPLCSMVLAYVLYHFFNRILARSGSRATTSALVKVLTLVAAMAVAYNLGANDVANAMGPLVGSNVLNEYALKGGWSSVESGHVYIDLHVLPTMVGALLGGVCLGLGAIMFGRGVVETMGGGITTLGPVSALGAQFASAITVYVFIQQGIPVSTTQAIVGGVIGVGLTKGTRTVNLRTIRNIMLGWLATPISGAVLSIAFYYILRQVLPA